MVTTCVRGERNGSERESGTARCVRFDKRKWSFFVFSRMKEMRGGVKDWDEEDFVEDAFCSSSSVGYIFVKPTSVKFWLKKTWFASACATWTGLHAP